MELVEPVRPPMWSWGDGGGDDDGDSVEGEDEEHLLGTLQQRTATTTSMTATSATSTMSTTPATTMTTRQGLASPWRVPGTVGAPKEQPSCRG